MKTGLLRLPALLPALGLAALAAAWGADAAAVRIDGLGALPLPAAVATPLVRGGELDVRLPQQQLTIAPWPAFLPQRFERQSVAAVRQLHPAGPTDRVSFTRLQEDRPWLQIVRGARPGSALFGDWRLQRAKQGWMIGNERSAYWIGDGLRPVSVAAGGERWCFYLLESRLPAPQGALVAAEAEAQADWVAVRQLRGQRCP